MNAGERLPLVDALARWRVAIGFALGAVVLWLAAPTPASLAIGGTIAAAGEGLRVWAAGHLNKGREVTVSGPYRWLGHPLYVGSSIMGAGLAVAAADWTVAAIIASYLAATLTAAARREETHLRRVFGTEYDRYRRGSAQTGRRRFSVARAVANHEHRAVIGLAIAVLLLALKATYNGMFWRAAAGR
jgi:hypothetical protein